MPKEIAKALWALGGNGKTFCCTRGPLGSVGHESIEPDAMTEDGAGGFRQAADSLERQRVEPVRRSRVLLEPSNGVSVQWRRWQWHRSHQGLVPLIA